MLTIQLKILKCEEAGKYYQLTKKQENVTHQRTQKRQEVRIQGGPDVCIITGKVIKVAVINMFKDLKKNMVILK